jgi:HK97 family phage portal protein
MNFLQRLLRPAEERSTLAAPSPELLALFGAAPAMGAFLTDNPASALASPTVAAAVKAIAETAGMLPIAIRRRSGTGWEKVADHPASKVLNGFASPWLSSEQLRTQLTVDALLNPSGGFAYVVRVDGKPRELQRLRPSVVTVEYDQATGEPQYLVSLATGGQQVVSWPDMIHLQAPGSAPDRTMCPAYLAREAIAIDLLLVAHERATFQEGGGLPRMFVSSEGALSEDALKNALKFLAAQINTKNGQPVIIPGAFKEAVKSFALGDQQFLELRRLSIEDIARGFRTPLSIVGDLTRGTFANTEQMGGQFLRLCLLPWLEQWESAVTRCLVPPEEREFVEAEFVVEDLLRGDITARSNAYRLAVGGSWRTPNEVRELDGLPPVEGGDKLILQAGQNQNGGANGNA